MSQGDSRSSYPHFLRIETRWADNDVYGHVNNATYYAFFDTAVNRFLIDCGVLHVTGSPAFGVVVETGCRYHRSLAFPDAIDAGVRVTKIGNSSVRYELGLFRAGEHEIAASGHFVHVYVDRATRKPVPIPPEVRAALEPLVR
jgi:acyl-CoA thioester hydrolase